MIAARKQENVYNSASNLNLNGQDPYGGAFDINTVHPFFNADQSFYLRRSVRGDNESVYSNNYAASIDSHTGSFTDAPGPRGSKDPYPALVSG